MAHERQRTREFARLPRSRLLTHPIRLTYLLRDSAIHVRRQALTEEAARELEAKEANGRRLSVHDIIRGRAAVRGSIEILAALARRRPSAAVNTILDQLDAGAPRRRPAFWPLPRPGALRSPCPDQLASAIVEPDGAGAPARVPSSLLAAAPAPGLQLGRTAQARIEVEGAASTELGPALKRSA